jgi:hypothetical protein
MAVFGALLLCIIGILILVGIYALTRWLFSGGNRPRL